MNIFEELRSDLKKKCLQICSDLQLLNQATLEFPKDPLNGDISTNVAMLLAARNQENSREIALKLKRILSDIPYISHIAVAGPGFINFTIKKEKWYSYIKSILNDEKTFWKVNVGKGIKVNIEYVSANPTGPMHIGHARGAIYGDVLANILENCGYQVTREYYINDAGSQIDTLIDTLLIRCKEIITAKEVKISKKCYSGEYLIDVAKKLIKKYGANLVSSKKKLIKEQLKPVVVFEMLELIKLDLKKLGVKHDVFTSEQQLHNDNKIDEAVNVLTEMGMIYHGFLPPPKGKTDKKWKEKKQLLLKSSNYGDNQDRPIKKTDGSWSYLAADFAYAKDKIDRGFEYLIYVLGADHIGYIRRIQAIIDAFGHGKIKSDIHTIQLVNFTRGNESIRMSKRNGNFITISDVISEVDKDIIRFIMLTRKNNAVLDFDFIKVKEQSRDNPVFYVQYAYVRTKSILAKAKVDIPLAYRIFIKQDFNLSLLSFEEEIQLIKLIASWPKILTLSAIAHEPQKLVNYLIDIASKFHSIWNLGKKDNNYRFNLETNFELTAARLALVETTRKVILNGLELIGIAPIDKM